MNKTLTALALGAILIPAAAIASDYHGERGEHRAERMAEYLQLSDQQRAEVQKIFDEQRAKRQEARERMRNETHERLAKVLTAEQAAKWQELRERRMAKVCDRDGKGEHHGHHEHGEGYRRGHDD